MKKAFALVTLFAALTGIVNAQGFKVGGKAGANLTKVSGMEFKDGFDLGYNVGAFAEIDFSKKWGIQPEVLWNQSNTRRASNFNAITNSWLDSTGTIKLRYLTIPVLLRYSIGDYLTLNAGPQFGILLDQDKTLLKNGEEAFKNGDFSMLAGVQLNVRKLRVYGRYAVGLADLNDIGTQSKWKSQQVQLGVGIVL